MPLSKAWLQCVSFNDIQNNSVKFTDMFCAEVNSSGIKNVEDPDKISFTFLILAWIFTAPILIHSKLVKKYGKCTDLN